MGAGLLFNFFLIVAISLSLLKKGPSGPPVAMALLTPCANVAPILRVRKD
jgi:hypothetical protein